MPIENLIARKAIGLFTIFERKPKPRFVSKFVVFQGDKQVQDFSRYSMALYWCKAQVPREVPHIVITLEGGLVRGVFSTHPCDYTVLDSDPSDLDLDANVLPIPNRNGGATDCYVHGDNATVDPERIAEILKAINPSLLSLP